MTDKVNEEFWSRTAENYDDDLIYVVGRDVIDAEIKKLGEEKNLGRVIEFACGTGLFTCAVAGNAEYVLATDISSEMIEIAAGRFAKYDNIEARTGSCYDCTLPDESFDTGLIVNSIHLIDSPVGALWEFHRVLKQGGKLIIATFTGRYLEPDAKQALANRFFEKFGKPPYAKNFTLDSLEEHLCEVGFNVEESCLLGEDVKALYLVGVKGKWGQSPIL